MIKEVENFWPLVYSQSILQNRQLCYISTAKTCYISTAKNQFEDWKKRFSEYRSNKAMNNNHNHYSPYSDVGKTSPSDGNKNIKTLKAKFNNNNNNNRNENKKIKISQDQQTSQKAHRKRTNRLKTNHILPNRTVHENRIEYQNNNTDDVTDNSNHRETEHSQVGTVQHNCSVNLNDTVNPTRYSHTSELTPCPPINDNINSSPQLSAQEESASHHPTTLTANRHQSTLKRSHSISSLPNLAMRYDVNSLIDTHADNSDSKNSTSHRRNGSLSLLNANNTNTTIPETSTPILISKQTKTSHGGSTATLEAESINSSHELQSKQATNSKVAFETDSVQQTNKQKPSIQTKQDNKINVLSLIHKIYSENKKKVAASSSHDTANSQRSFNMLNPFKILYRQPSEMPSYYENIANFKQKRPDLLKLIRHRLFIQYRKEHLLCAQQDECQENWEKFLEESAEERKAVENKTREIYERNFDIKRRETHPDKLRDVLEYCDDINSINSIEHHQRVSAIIPAMVTDPNEKNVKFISRNGYISDPVKFSSTNSSTNIWLESEKKIFHEKFQQYPKNFEMIATSLRNKSISDCVAYYYLNKKQINLKHNVKGSNTKRRKTILQSRDHNQDIKQRFYMHRSRSNENKSYKESLRATNTTPNISNNNSSTNIASTNNTNTTPNTTTNSNNSPDMSCTIKNKKISEQNWSTEDICKFRCALSEHGRSWNKVSQVVGRPTNHCKQFYEEFGSFEDYGLQQVIRERRLRSREKSEKVHNEDDALINTSKISEDTSDNDLTPLTLLDTSNLSFASPHVETKHLTNTQTCQSTLQSTDVYNDTVSGDNHSPVVYHLITNEHTYSIKDCEFNTRLDDTPTTNTENSHPSCNNTKLSTLSPRAETNFLQHNGAESLSTHTRSKSAKKRSTSKSVKTNSSSRTSRTSQGDDRVSVNETPQQIEISCHSHSNSTDNVFNASIALTVSSHHKHKSTRDMVNIPDNKPLTKDSVSSLEGTPIYDTTKQHFNTQDTNKPNHHTRNDRNNGSELRVNKAIEEEEKPQMFIHQTAAELEDSGNDSDTDSDSGRLVIDMAPTLCTSELETGEVFQKQLSTSSCSTLLPVNSLDDQEALPYKEIHELSAEESIEVTLDESPTNSHSPAYSHNNNHHPANIWLYRDSQLNAQRYSDELENDTSHFESFPVPFKKTYELDQSEGDELRDLLNQKLIIPTTIHTRPPKKNYNDVNNRIPKLNGLHTSIPTTFTPPRQEDKQSRKKSISSQHVYSHRQADNRNSSIEKALPSEINESLHSLNSPACPAVNTIIATNERELQWAHIAHQNSNSHQIINNQVPNHHQHNHHQHQSSLPTSKRNGVALNNCTNAKDRTSKHSKRFKSEPLTPQTIGILGSLPLTPPISIKHQIPVQELIRSPSPAQKQETFYMIAPSHAQLPYATPSGPDSIARGYPIYSLPTQQSQQMHAIHPNQSAYVPQYGQPILIHSSQGPQILTTPHPTLQQQYAHRMYVTPQQLYTLAPGELGESPLIANSHNMHPNTIYHHPLIYTTPAGNMGLTDMAYQQSNKNLDQN